ncbi:MAG TPA: serine/threonine-protein kinase, partial [Gemmataceae bacterium]|nr:serine/threonine-protein kinase [Gemmataceae bacterium]
MPGDEKETRPDLEAHAAEVGPPSWHPPHHTPPPLPSVTDPTVVAPTDLGRGGMGVVYLAYDASLDREIALKVIPAGPDADPTDLARFQAEAETAARLHHPNIVPVFEVGKTEDVAYMAMEFVSGGNLHSHLTKAPPTPTEAARLVEQLARGIEYAHEHGVIHRDLKPSNVLLTAPTADRGGRAPDGEPPPPRSAAGFQPTPKVADFGLAKRVDRPLHLTRSGVALGTPNYMAPEQARGLSGEIGPAADIHALGAILYELLVGFPPFGGGTPMETMHQVVHKTPVSPAKLRHGIPPALEQICLRCLEKQPRKRFATAGELAAALESFRTGTSLPEAPSPPVLATPAEPVPAVPRRRLRVLIRRRRWPWSWRPPGSA